MVIRNSYCIQIQLMAYRTSLNNKYYNSEDFIVVDFDDEYFYVKAADDVTIKIDTKHLLTTLNRYIA